MAATALGSGIIAALRALVPLLREAQRQLRHLLGLALQVLWIPSKRRTVRTTRDVVNVRRSPEAMSTAAGDTKTDLPTLGRVGHDCRWPRSFEAWTRPSEPTDVQ